MERILLRKMTLKSRFDGGQHDGQTVAEVLALRPTYLSYNYYHYDKISFVDEILEEIGIVGEWVIDKPGKNPDMFVPYLRKNYSWSELSDLDIIKKKAQKKNRLKRIISHNNMERSLKWNKAHNMTYGRKGYLK